MLDTVLLDTVREQCSIPYRALLHLAYSIEQTEMLHTVRKQHPLLLASNFTSFSYCEPAGELDLLSHILSKQTYTTWLSLPLLTDE